MKEALVYEDNYAFALSHAMRRPATRAYILNRVFASLTGIGIASDCATDVVSLLSTLVQGADNGQSLASKVVAFQRVWRRHLDRAYLDGYEASRWAFVDRWVLGQLDDKLPFGRTLDLGCGRGCLTAQLARTGAASEVVGIDAADFAADWREQRARAGRALRFDRVAPAALDQWLESTAQFDTIFLFYVLHHADHYWGARTLRTLREFMSRTGRIIIVEDSLLDGIPMTDPLMLSTWWQSWSATEAVFALTPAFDAQLTLDFTAVQLLAGFEEVGMPATYRRGAEWVSLFNSLGYAVLQTGNIGFPENRDIDVPQAFFVIRPQ